MTVKVFFCLFVCLPVFFLLLLFFLFSVRVFIFYPVYWPREGFSDYNIHFPIIFVDRLQPDALQLSSYHITVGTLS